MLSRQSVLASLVAVVALALPLAANGCVVVKKGSVVKDIAEYPASTADDRPNGYQEGAPAAFWVWRGPKGGWHVRTTTAGKEHHFHGEIAVRGGGIMTELKANRTELNDRVRGNPSGAAFEFKTAGFEDGVDFRVEPGNCIEFELKIDTKAQPDKINLGGHQTHPSSHRFKLCD